VPLLVPLEPPPLLPGCCVGNGDSLPAPDWLGLWLPPGLPPEVDGEEAGVDVLGGCGIDDVCVWVVVEQPTRPSAQATGQTMPWKWVSRIGAGTPG
jgi:hypothetical protein